MVVDQEKEKRRKRAVAKHRLREKEDKNLIKIVKWWVNILLEPIGGCWGGGMVESAGSDAEMSRWEIHQLKYTEKKTGEVCLRYGMRRLRHATRMTLCDSSWLLEPAHRLHVICDIRNVACVCPPEVFLSTAACSLQDCWKPTVCRRL